MKKQLKLILLSLTIILFSSPVLAISSLVDTSAEGYAKGDYKLEYIREYAIYIANIILGLVGTISLIAFVVGGFMFLISAGDAARVKKGKEIIIAAVIGIAITFSSVFILNTFFKGVGISWNTNTGAINIPKK